MTGDQEGADFTKGFMKQAEAFLKDHYSCLPHFDILKKQSKNSCLDRCINNFDPGSVHVWHWDRYFPVYTGFPVSFIPPVLHYTEK
jgi:hypothetical protein